MANTSENASRNQGPLEEATYEELAAALTTRLIFDRERVSQQIAEVAEAERRLDEKQRALREMEKKLFCCGDSADDVVELNVGGQPMSTSRAVLCSAEGSLLAGMFSGHFDEGLKRDKENRVFLDWDPPLFAKMLSHLRLRRISSKECPAPLPNVPEETRAEFDMMVRYFGLDTFIYGDVGGSCNVFQAIAESADVCQSKLQSNELVQIILSSTGGVPATNHEEVLGIAGFNERSLENSYGTSPNVITIKFLKHRVWIEAMEIRAKVADIASHMSNQWTFRHGSDSVNMQYSFTRAEPSTGRLETTGLGPSFTTEIIWVFPSDFCLEHVVLHGRVAPK